MRTSIIALCLLCCSCGFAVRALSRSLSAPPERQVAHKLTDVRRPEARIAVLWIGHATVLLQLDDIFVLTDPVFTHTLGQVSPRLVEPGLDPQNIPPLAAVLISHMHLDHLSFASLDQVETKTPVVLVPPDVRANMPRYDFEIRELARWQTYSHEGLSITAVPVQHVGGRYGIDAAFNRHAFTGYVIEYHGLRVYFGGDTGYWPDAFRATRARFPDLALAIVPICPDAPRDFMEHTHVGPSQALDAFELLGAQQLVPIHYDTFINSDDVSGGCGSMLRQQLRARQLDETRAQILAIGEQRVLLPRPNMGR